MTETAHSQLLKPRLPAPGEAVDWRGLHGSASALAIAEAARAHQGMLVVVMPGPRRLRVLQSDLGFFLGQNDAEVLSFPGWECLPYDTFSPHQDIISRRLRILSQLPSMRRGILLTTCANLMQRLPPRAYVFAHSFSLASGQRIDLDALRQQLADANYAAVQQVMTPGEFALRGGLVDIFPMGAEAPFRLDLFDDEIESIRYFDPDTQRSNAQAGRVDSIELLPAREFPMNEDGITAFRQNFRRHIEADPRSQQVYVDISGGRVSPGAEFFLPLFFDHTCTLFDYLADDALCIAPADVAGIAEAHWAEVKERRENASYDIARKVLPAEMLYLSPMQLAAALKPYRRIALHAEDDAEKNAHSKRVKKAWQAGSAAGKQLPADARDESPYRHLLAHLHAAENRVLLALETAGRREAMEGVLAKHDLHADVCDGFAEFVAGDSKLALCVYPLERGLRLPDCGLEVVAESQLYGEAVYRQRRGRDAAAQDPEAVIRSLAELHEGDPVVHLEHGVGRYRGLESMEVDAQQSEFLILEYRDGDKLYVPVLSLNLISRFVGGAAEHAPLHKLGGEKWNKARKRAREKAHDVATELLEMQALRRARQGSAMQVPEEEYQAFVGRFAFEETADQTRAIGEVRADLESPRPMDRLVCGDVGFGKTEVALRAAFIAVHNDCQVAILTPTTLLARQHYDTFVDRFADLSISVEMLSRFKTPKQAAALVARMKEGYPDIVVGTHRLLQPDVGFKNLGLLIIDEEHRFGVRQKERIKQLRSQVDILTLTATPIPRTLNITMAGLRAISLITTAPAMRLSIKTFVREWSHGLIREAVLREIRRGGQVYFLYNEVRSIERFSADLAELVPEAEIRFGHGQMGEARLERVMQDFYHRRFNVLVCSTIIESGLDIPSANTIIIHRADRFGLAQLHQLRGRVGRSHHQAFAYLLIPGREFISRDARKRLDAFGLMEELGAGFALASHDLEIRGAGELLGETQSGLIDDVGFALYGEYLNAAVTAIQDGDAPQASAELATARVDLHLPAVFPNDYLGNPHARLLLYKRIAGAGDEQELDELQVETTDRFGRLPAAGKNLFRLTALRLQCERLGIARLELNARGGTVEFGEKPAVEPGVVLAMVRGEPKRYQLAGPDRLKVRGEFAEDTRVEDAEGLLRRLAGVTRA